MSVLALDCGKSTGWSRSDGRCGTLALGSYADEGEAVAMFQRWLAGQLSEDRPELLLIERAFFTSRIRGADFTAALIRCAHAIAWMHDVPRCELTADEVRRAVFGRARGVTDAERVSAIRALRRWPLWSNHIADACALIVAHELLQSERAA